MSTAILFDLDGTLIDSLPTVTDAANAVLIERRLPAVAPDLVAGFVGLGEQVFIDRLIAATGLAEDDRDGIMETFLRHYEEEALKTKCFHGVHRALQRLGEDGFPLGLVTNKPRGPLIPTLEAAGIAPLFEVVVAGDDLRKRKPDPAPLQHALEKTGANACIYVGDSPTDAATARNAGVPFILFTEGIRTVPVHDIPHDVAFNDFGMLPAICARFAT